MCVLCSDLRSFDRYPFKYSAVSLGGGRTVMKCLFLCSGTDDRVSAAALERESEGHERTTMLQTGASRGNSRHLY